MKLKYRLVVAFLIIVLLPVIMVAIILFAFGRMGNDNPGGYLGNLFSSNDSIDRIKDLTSDRFNELISDIDDDAGRFTDIAYLEGYNETLRDSASCLIVRQGDVEIFNGSFSNLGYGFSDIPSVRHRAEGIIYISEDGRSNLIRHVDTGLSGADRPDIYFVTDGRVIAQSSREEILDTIVSVVIILSLTAVILILWIYNGVISRVNRLIFGANNIKEGNLDFSIATSGTDELSELINTFEAMKERLRKDQEEKLLAEKEQRELISNIAHDIKTPLTAIRGYAEGLLDGVADTDEKKEAYIRTIGKKAEELNILLNELTVYSNITTNRIPYNFRQINAAEYFRDLTEESAITYETAGFGYDFSLDIDDSCQIIADPEQIRRVVENLIDNSIKYRSEREPFVNIRARQLEGFVQLEIEDNGLGIANDDLPHIFDRLYRGDPSRNTAVGGSGIGLSIAKKIIEDHGGRIWATSRQNEGSCFYVILRQYYPPGTTEVVENEKNTDNRRRRKHSRA